MQGICHAQTRFSLKNVLTTDSEQSDAYDGSLLSSLVCNNLKHKSNARLTGFTTALCILNNQIQMNFQKYIKKMKKSSTSLV